MKIVLRSQARKLVALRNRLKDLFYKLIRRQREKVVYYGRFSPLVNIYSDADKLVYEIEVPGMDGGDLNVTLDSNILAVRGERRSSRDGRRGNWLWRESFHGAFETSFTLPEWVEPDSIRAKTRNGLLRIEVDKKVWARPKRVPITSGLSQLSPRLPEGISIPGKNQEAEV